jgi:hypothetical protein
MQRVLILHAGALGDCALTLHVVSAIRRASPETRVTMAARSGLVRWAKRRGIVHEAMSLENLPLRPYFSPDDEPRHEAADFFRPFDRVISFLGGPNESVSRRLGEVLGDRLVSVDPRPSETTLNQGRHITQQWAVDLSWSGQALNLPNDGIEIERHVRKDFTEVLAARIDAGGRPAAICHPGSGGLSKCCPLAAMETLVRGLRGHDWAVGWMIGPDEFEQFGSGYVERLGRTAPVIYEESVELAADLACGAHAFVGNDAGMTHVAALAGIPTVAIFGPTEPRVWRPLGPKCRVVHFPGTYGPFIAWADHIIDELKGLIGTRNDV